MSALTVWLISPRDVCTDSLVDISLRWKDSYIYTSRDSICKQEGVSYVDWYIYVDWKTTHLECVFYATQNIMRQRRESASRSVLMKILIITNHIQWLVITKYYKSYKVACKYKVLQILYGGL